MLQEGSHNIQEEARDIQEGPSMWRLPSRNIREEPSMWRLPSRDIREGFDGREAAGDRGEASETGFARLQHPDGR